MRLSNSAILLTLSAIFALGAAGCGNGGDVSPAAEPVIAEPKSDIPYSSREPDRYRALAVITSGGIESTAAIARDGANFRIDFAPGTGRQITLLRSDRTYVLSDVHRIYAERPVSATPAPETFIEDLTLHLLHRRDAAAYEPLGTENGLAKYRVRLGKDTEEIIVHVDEELGMPVIQEFFTVENGNRELLYRFALRDVGLDVERELFAVPADYRKTGIDEFYRTRRNSAPGKN